MKSARFLIFGAALAVCATVSAQYQWVDKDGRKVYSDRPPPADVPQQNVLKKPRGASAAPAGTPAAEASPATNTPRATAAAKPASAAGGAGTDKALEEKKKQAEAAEAAKKKADEEKLAAQRAENCKRAMSAKAGLDSGVRIARTNEKGEREILDDAQRAAELQRAQSVINSECK